VFHNTREDIIKKCKDLNRVLVEECIPVKVIPGSEVRMCPEVMEGLEDNSIMTINDNKKYIYIELTDQFLTDAVMSFLKIIKDKKITPIISHPERNNAICGNLDALKLFVSAGAMTQVTGTSLMGKFGKKSLKFVRKMAEENLIHLVGSDCHSVKERKPELSGVYRKFISLMKREEVDRIFFDNPLRIIKGV
jgi:protein-tyrosine phosphatase